MKKFISVFLMFLIACSLILNGCDSSEPPTEENTSVSLSTCTHQWLDADCEHPKTCSLCYKTEGKALDHVYGDWVTVKEPTADESGKKERTCTVCGNTTTNSIPAVGASEEYQFHTFEALRFAYPGTWDEELLCSADFLSSITVLSDASAILYQDMTLSELENLLSTMFSDSSLQFSNISAERQENAFGLDINVLTYQVCAEENTQRICMYAVTLNETPYLVQLITPAEDANLEEIVFQSIHQVPFSEDVSEEPVTYTNYNLQFSLPGLWLTTDQQTFYKDSSSLMIFSGAATTKFSDMTEEDYRDYVTMMAELMGASLETVSVEHFTTQNDLSVSLLSYSMSFYGMNVKEVSVSVTIDQTTHLFTLYDMSEDAESLIPSLIDSLTPIDGPNDTSTDNDWETMV